MDEPRKPRRPSGGSALLMLLLLLLVVGALVAWAMVRNPPDVPRPSATAAPATLPPGQTSGPTAR
ncbi:MAG: hypothetical protein JWN69_430 [Alphaproteobacteria bacterium]|nr:hypothetical protein [Alphaproteobacteria bacterium]